MDKVIKATDVVGAYERVNIIHCNSCCKDRVHVLRFVRQDEADFAPLEPLVCSFCGDKDYMLSTNFGTQFVCPDCGKENVQALEPSHISHHGCDRLLCYSASEITCMYCESEFGLCMFIDGFPGCDPTNPDTWKNTLYKLNRAE